MSALIAAATLAEKSGWSLSNLQIQKLLYLAQMFHMGENNGAPLFDDDFQAWKLGPVIPSVYQRAKIFGSRPVETLFTDTRLPEGTGKATIEKMLRELPDKSPWRLVSITHWNDGAWAKNYEDGDFGCIIPKPDILSEYQARASKARARAEAI